MGRNSEDAAVIGRRTGVARLTRLIKHAATKKQAVTSGAIAFRFPCSNANWARAHVNPNALKGRMPFVISLTRAEARGLPR
eukprot:scaffold177801_cov28-Tisochrysis_lutea.AAC.4